MWSCSLILCALALGLPLAESRSQRDESPARLMQLSKEELDRAKSDRRQYSVAKNTILVIGDGLGVSTVTAARIYMGQMEGQSGEEYKLSFEDLPHVGLAKTYSIDRQTPDSAATATALLAGQKINWGAVGVASAVPYGDVCTELTEDTKLTTVLDMSLAEGKSVGIVTNTRITHATPASAFAHTNNRNWESDTDKDGYPGCDHVHDIAYDLVVNNPNINVLLGGGWRSFIPENMTKPPATKPDSHQRKDGLNLIEMWQKDKQDRNLKHAFVENTKELMDVDASNVDYLFGLFSKSHMDYDAYRDKTDDGQPSLTEMVDKALKILSKNPKGYFLLVEGGRIDHAHHDNLAKLSLDETVAFDKAVSKLKADTSEKDTLLIITADHSHVFAMGGYSSRGNDILGLVDWYAKGEDPMDDKPFLTLSYTNGPAGRVDGPRINYTNMDTTGFDFVQPADVPVQWESHGGEDVAIYSRGPMSHLIHTTHEQSHVGHVMMYAACLGPYNTDALCDREERQLKATGNFASKPRVLPQYLLFFGAVLVWWI